MDVFNRAGLRLVRRGPGWVVGVIYPGSPAADAGLKSGDFVIHVDGLTVDALGQEELVGKLTGPAGTRIELRVHMAGGDRSVVLSSRDFL